MFASAQHGTAKCNGVLCSTKIVLLNSSYVLASTHAVSAAKRGQQVPERTHQTAYSAEETVDSR